jgi:polyhydroxyalkanoate synthesis regulator phasin
MSEEKRYKMKKIIEGGVIRYQKVEITSDDIIVEKDLEIKNLKTLVDSLREQITQLEQEKQRYQLRNAPMDSAESYQIYK